MRERDYFKKGAVLKEAGVSKDPALTLYALESFASNVDGRVQSELLTRLILSHSEIACRLEETMKTLAKSEADLKEAQHIALLGYWDGDLRTEKREWSESLYEIIEVDPSTPPSIELFLSRIHPNDEQKVREVVRQPRKDRRDWSLQARLLMDDGRIKWVSMKFQTELAEHGMPARGYGTIQDITAMKEAEDKLERYNQHLQEMVSEKVREISEAQMSTIFALVKLSESRDDDTGAHIERTAGFCGCWRKRPGRTGRMPRRLTTSSWERFIKQARCTISARSALRTRSCSSPQADQRGIRSHEDACGDRLSNPSWNRVTV
jgi:putative two-component system response regulator